MRAASRPLIMPRSQQSNTTAACTHKGGSSSHTCRAARCTGCEVSSWELQVPQHWAEPSWPDRTTPLLFLLPLLWRYWILCQDVDAPWSQPPSSSSSPAAPLKHLIAHSALGWDSPVHSQLENFTEMSPNFMHVLSKSFRVSSGFLLCSGCLIFLYLYCISSKIKIEMSIFDPIFCYKRKHVWFNLVTGPDPSSKTLDIKENYITFFMLNYIFCHFHCLTVVEKLILCCQVSHSTKSPFKLLSKIVKFFDKTSELAFKTPHNFIIIKDTLFPDMGHDLRTWCFINNSTRVW